MTLRARIILITLIGLGCIVALFVIIKIVQFYRDHISSAPVSTQPTVPSKPDQGQTSEQSVHTSLPPLPPPEIKNITTPQERTKEDVAGFVLPFVERLGSYSNQGSYENLSDVMPLMTEHMKKWAQSLITEAQSRPVPTIYKGTTTRALSYTFDVFDEKNGTAQLTVTAQRKDMVGSSTNVKIYNQSVLVSLIKDGPNDAWLVDRADWKNAQ